MKLDTQYQVAGISVLETGSVRKIRGIDQIQCPGINRDDETDFRPELGAVKITSWPMRL